MLIFCSPKYPLSVKYSGETTVAKPHMLDNSVIFPICYNHLPSTTKQFIGACLLMKQQHPLTRTIKHMHDKSEKLQGTLRGHYCELLSYSERSTDENVNNTASARKHELFSMNEEKTELQDLIL